MLRIGLPVLIEYVITHLSQYNTQVSGKYFSAAIFLLLVYRVYKNKEQTMCEIGIYMMMYFKNNWNAGPFTLLHGYYRRKKPHIYIYI
jgi:hypothetical protein